jgi:hypothetical protein
VVVDAQGVNGPKIPVKRNIQQVEFNIVRDERKRKSKEIRCDAEDRPVYYPIPSKKIK